MERAAELFKRALESSPTISSRALLLSLTLRRSAG